MNKVDERDDKSSLSESSLSESSLGNEVESLQSEADSVHAMSSTTGTDQQYRMRSRMAPFHPGRRSSSAMMPMHALGHMHHLNQDRATHPPGPSAPPRVIFTRGM